MRFLFFLILPFLILPKIASAQVNAAFLVILGVAQDGGYPHLGCEKVCCEYAWKEMKFRRYITSMALADPQSGKWWLIEATPDITEQLHLFRELTDGQFSYLPDGVFITHAHIGHYTGLMQFGREVMNTNDLPVFVLPKMKQYLENHGPWSQLVQLKNILLAEIKDGAKLFLSEGFWIQAFTVPHRDEFSETAGFKIHTKAKTYLFIPDIDKWSKWKKNIVDEVKSVDYAFVDGTFFEAAEIKNRNIEEIPHPLVIETMELFQNQIPEIKSKLHFIHLNHTNALLWSNDARKIINKKGFRIAEQGARY